MAGKRSIVEGVGKAIKEQLKPIADEQRLINEGFDNPDQSAEARLNRGFDSMRPERDIEVERLNNSLGESSGPAYFDAENQYKEMRDLFLDDLPEDSEAEDVLRWAQQQTPQVRNYINALERDDWLGFDYPSQAISSSMTDQIDRFETSQGLRQSLGVIANKGVAPAAAVAVGVTAMTQSEEADAGLLDTGARLFDKAYQGAKRTDQDERAIEVNPRAAAARTMPVSNQEKSKIRESLGKVKGTKVTGGIDAARNFKDRHPSTGVELPWAKTEVTGVEAIYNPNTKKYSYKAQVKQIPYAYNIDPKTGKPAPVGSPYFNVLTARVGSEIVDIARRADANDPAAQRIMANAGWYKNVQQRGFNEYGSFFDTFGDLLGATSPNTPVGTNFNFSRAIVSRLGTGELDEKIELFSTTLNDIDNLVGRNAELEQIAKDTDGQTVKQAKQSEEYMANVQAIKAHKAVLDNDPLLQQTREKVTYSKSGNVKIETVGEGKRYGINSGNAMIALADKWRIFKKDSAPKAKNFSGNLVGYSEKATIDVWAARNLRRHSGRPQIPSQAEQGVVGTITDPGTMTSGGEFGFGQDVLAKATDDINAQLGTDYTPADVQALQWFAEKELWSKNGWTNAMGEGGSFETMMDNSPTSSWIAGTSRAQSLEFQGIDVDPTAADQQALIDNVQGKFNDDPDVVVSKAKTTQGRYYSDTESSLDIDVVTQAHTIPTQAFTEVARQAVKDNQDSFFVARRISTEVGHQRPGAFTVGAELYFKEAMSGDSVLIKNLMRRLNKQDVPGFTYIIDPRPVSQRTTPLPEGQGKMVTPKPEDGAMPDGVIGVRFLDIPQFQDADKFARMSDAEYEKYAINKHSEYTRITDELSSNPNVRTSGAAYFDVNVKSNRQAEEFVAQLSNTSRDRDALNQDMWGFKPATTRFKEYSGKQRPYYSQSGTGAGRTAAAGTATGTAVALISSSSFAEDIAPAYAQDIEQNLTLAYQQDSAGISDDSLAEAEARYQQAQQAPAQEEPSMMQDFMDKATDPAYLAQSAIEIVPQAIKEVGLAVSEINDTINDAEDWGRELLGFDEMDPAGSEAWNNTLKIAGLTPDQRFQPLEVVAGLADAYADAIGEADTGPGAAAGFMARVLAPLGAYNKALKSMGWTGELFKGSNAARLLTAETAAGATALDPFEETFAGMLEAFEITEDFGLWMNEKDSEAEGRVKNAIDIALAGTAFEAAIAGLSGPAKFAARQARKVIVSPLGMKVIAGMGSLYYARQKAKQALKPLDETAAATQALEIEQRKMKVLHDAAGNPDAPIYNHGANSIDEVEINFSRIETEDDVKQLIDDLANSDLPEIDNARRGVVGWDQTTMEAGHVNAMQTLIDRRVGEPLNAAQTVAVRNLWLKSGEQAHSLAQKLAVDPSPANMIAYKRQLVLHTAIQREVLGARAETARALGAWRIPSNTADLSTLTDQLTNEQDILAIAQKHLTLQEAGLTEAADTFLYGSAWAKGRAAVAQMWYFSLLSGPKTHARNIIGNGLVSIISPMERELAAGVGRLKGVQNVEQGEGLAQIYGMMMGAKRALRVSRDSEKLGTVWQSLKTGESGIGLGKVEQPLIGGFNPEALEISSDSPFYWPAKVTDAALSVPGRALAGADEFFKTAAYDGEIMALAYRDVRKKVKSGEIDELDFADYVNRLVADPDEYMSMAARAKAQRNTFTDTPESTKVNEAWQKMAKVPVLGKLTLPFNKTPYNIGLYAFERTPLAPVVKRFRDDIAAGGARADVAQAQLVMGNTLLMIGAEMAINGTITGQGPVDRRENEAWAQEHSRYSFEYELEDGTNRSISYQGIEPVGTFLSLSSSIVDILTTQDWDDDNKDVKDLALAASISIAATMTSQQYMRGLSDFFAMMDDPGKEASYYFNRLGGMASPTILSQTAQVMDPNFRHVGSMIEAIKARTPGLSETLPATFDRWGQTRSRRSGFGPIYDGMSPFYSSDHKPEPIDFELRRIEKHFGKPSKTQTFSKEGPTQLGEGGVKINLKDQYPHAYWRMVELRGNGVTKTKYGAPITASNFASTGGTLREELNDIVRGSHPMSSYYEMLTDGEDGAKAAYMGNIISAYNRAAKDQILIEFPELRAEVERRTSVPMFKFQQSNGAQ